jgi:hypothetical protein
MHMSQIREKDWAAFEGDKWREAVLQHGLSLRSLDPEERSLVCESIKRKIVAARARVAAARIPAAR